MFWQSAAICCLCEVDLLAKALAISVGTVWTCHTCIVDCSLELAKEWQPV